MQPPQQPPQGPYPPQSPQSTPPYGYYPPQQPQSPPPYGYPPPQQPQQPPQSTAAQKVTAWSAGLIALVIVGPIIVVGLCIAACFGFGIIGAATSPDLPPTP